MLIGMKRYHAPENDQGGGGGDNFDDLAPLGKDGGGQDDSKQDDVGERGSKLDKLLDDHLLESDRGTGRGTDKAADTTGQGKDAPQDQQKQPSRTQGQGTNQDDRTQQRGQGTDQRQPNDQATRTPRNVGSMFRANGDGSIYDLQGRKVANTGLERRVFDRVTRYYNGIETEYVGLKNRITAYEEANAVAKRENLSLEETAFGLRLVSAWKKDPLETLNFLLTQAQQQGKDVSTIRSGGAAFDPAAVGQLFEEKLDARFKLLQPLIDQLQEAHETNEIRDQVANDIAVFFEEHPDAAQHRPVIGALMQKMDTGDPKLAWAELRVSAAQNGWDLTKPLGPQAQATRQRNGAPTRDGNSRTVPDMTGRGGGGGGNGATVRAGALGAAGKDDSWDDIVGDALGYRL